MLANLPNKPSLASLELKLIYRSKGLGESDVRERRACIYILPAFWNTVALGDQHPEQLHTSNWCDIQNTWLKHNRILCSYIKHFHKTMAWHISLLYHPNYT